MSPLKFTQLILHYQSYQTGEHVICTNEYNHCVSLNNGVGRKTIEKMPMGSDRINDITEKCFYSQLSYLLSKEDINELEGTILTAIYWIGEAQNDFDHDSAYIKYWTSLETPFSISENEITQTLAKSISTLIGFSGYDFIETKDIKKIHKSLKKHYQKRSKIIHRGVNSVVTPHELNEICKYASWSVLSLLAIREKGYKNLSQIKDEIGRLYLLIDNE